MKVQAYQVAMNATHQNLALESVQTSTHRDAKNFSKNTENFNAKESKVEKISSKQTPKTDTEAKAIKGIAKALLQRIQSDNDKATNLHGIRFIYGREEHEEIHFQTQAIIQADNKEISVDLNVNLKRSFVEKIKLSAWKKGVVRDPLVIALDGSMPTLSDKKFSFDIDSDGKSDQISLLGANSAFLALDKNENGKIDNGNELFGTQSGNGFKDLAQYDDDKNGWIDENDKIFDKLRIWQKKEGKDLLVGLGEIGIGAIFLGNLQTDYSYKTLQTNALNGQLKSSGFVLFENGRAGTISQVDFAVSQNTQTSQSKTSTLDEMASKSTKILNSKEKDKTNPYSQTSKSKNKSHDQTQTPIERLKAKIKTLQGKLAHASHSERGTIQAQIAGLQSQLINVIFLSSKTYEG